MEKFVKYEVCSLDEDFRGKEWKSNDNLQMKCSEHGVFTTKLYLAMKGNSSCPVCFSDVKVYEYGTKGYCMQDALRYKTRTEWQKKSAAAYHFAHRGKWLDECCVHMVSPQKPNGFWGKERCMEDALKYSTKKEWQNKSSSAYKAAHKNNWLDECSTHMVETHKPHGYWDKGRCKEDALCYDTKSEWKNKSSSAYSAAVKNKWVVECCVHMVGIKKLNGYWTKEKCKEDALNYNTKTEWQKKSSSARNAAQKNNWSDECCVHMIEIYKPNGYWTIEKCQEDALNHSTRSEWKNNSSAYQIAVKNKWVVECCVHMVGIKKLNGYWTKEKCREDALKYDTKMEWRKKSSAYTTAHNNKWVDECCAHMVSGRTKRKPVTQK